MNRRSLLKTLVAVGAAILGPRLLVGPARAAQTVHLNIKKFKFDPKPVIVKVGDTLVVTNQDGARHTATAKDKSWDTGTLKKDQSVEIAIVKGMDPDFTCRFHPNMSGFLKIDG